MDEMTAPCRVCGEDVLAATTVCRGCGYDVAHHNRRRLALGAIGTVLTLTIVFAPVGLPLLAASHRHRSLATGTATTPTETTFLAHLRGVLAHQLAVDRSDLPRGDFTRGGSAMGAPLSQPPEL